jgi:hypothetical protein
MGLDFLREKRQPHRKTWNEQLLHLIDDLFVATSKHDRSARVFRSALEPSISCPKGTEVLLRKTSAGQVIVSQDIHSIATITEPSKDLLTALETHHGILPGRIHDCLTDLQVAEIEVEI